MRDTIKNVGANNTMSQKLFMSKSTSKIVKNSSPNGAPGNPGAAREPPGSLPGPSQAPVGTVFESRPRMSKNLKRSGRIPEALLGAGRDPKIDQKSTCGQKGGIRARARKRFSWIFGAIAVSGRFLNRFSMFWDVIHRPLGSSVWELFFRPTPHPGPISPENA